MSRINCSMLQSAHEYALWWEFRKTRLYTGPTIKPQVCFCDGGLPMMKPDCPRHGHLVRAGDEAGRSA